MAAPALRGGMPRCPIVPRGATRGNAAECRNAASCASANTTTAPHRPTARSTAQCDTTPHLERSASCKIRATTTKRFMRHVAAWQGSNDARAVPNRSASAATRCRVATQLQQSWQTRHVATQPQCSIDTTVANTQHCCNADTTQHRHSVALLPQWYNMATMCGTLDTVLPHCHTCDKIATAGGEAAKPPAMCAVRPLPRGPVSGCGASAIYFLHYAASTNRSIT